MADHDDDDGAPAAGYAWEKGYERSWEGVEEDEEGNLRLAGLEASRRGRSRKTRIDDG